MKKILSFFVLAMLIMPTVMAEMNETQKAYISGFQAGFLMGQQAFQARGNTTAASMFNENVDLFNAALDAHFNSTDAKILRLEYIQPTQVILPQILQNMSMNPWAV